MNSADNFSIDKHDETLRLEIQRRRAESIDSEVFRFALERISRNNLFALDVGCDSGETTDNRFNKFNCFEKIFAVDKNEMKICEAKANIDSEIYRFMTLDVEDKDFKDKFISSLKKFNRETVDFIFASLILHHLEDPVRGLISLNDLLDCGGCIIVRGSDDGAKLCYPEFDVLKSILDDSGYKSLKISDRENSRKLFRQLKRAGFSDIKLFYDVFDTVGMSRKEREQFYFESFSFRLTNIRRAISDGNLLLKKKYSKIQTAFDRLKTAFLNDDFYYMEIATVAVAWKK